MMRALLLLLTSTAMAMACPLCALQPAEAPIRFRMAGGVVTTEEVVLNTATQEAIFAAFAKLNERVGASATSTWLEIKMVDGCATLRIHTKALQGAIVP